MNVMTAQSAATQERKIMTTFSIDHENNISVFATAEDAAAATTTPLDSFTSQQELAELAAGWPAERLLAVWNSLPGVTPVKRFQDQKTATTRIWKRIQKLGTAGKPEPGPQANAGARAAKGAPAKAKATKKATSAHRARKTKKGASQPEPAAPREGSKMAQVIAMLQRKNGATLGEIVNKMNWQKHTVRGFMAGAMKKAGYRVESFKPDGGDRTYRLLAK
jgi:hypothetical protein